jgi:seryl-tRNA(Sec) selenium transferase
MPRVIDLAPGLTHGLATEPASAEAGAAVARRLAAPAATLAHGFAGAVLVALLAVRPEARRLVFMAAHDIEIAGPLRHLVGLAGGEPVAVGSVDRLRPAELEAALAGDVAAVLHVADDSLPRSTLPPLPVVRHLAHLRGIPTIVLAPGRPDAEALLDAGADLLVLDGAQALGGPPLGIVAGRLDLVALAEAALAAGPGRLVAPAPDHLAQLLAALDDDPAGRVAHLRARLAEALAGRPGLRLLPAPHGLALQLNPPVAGTTAGDLAHALAAGDPVILVDDRHALAQRLDFDLRRLDEASVALVHVRLKALLAGTIPPAPWP